MRIGPSAYLAELAELAVYFHIPFCKTKCCYCDFYSVTGSDGGIIDRTLKVLVDTLDESLNRWRPHRISTVFIGGGTPTQVPPDRFEKFLCDIGHLVGKVDEFTVEVNPESLSQEMLALLSESMVDRLSMGAQCYDDALLKWLGRPAGLQILEEADSLLSRHWSGRLNRDLLAGLPRQSGGMLRDIQKALKDNPGHLSVYELTVEPGTLLSESPAMLGRLPRESAALAEWTAVKDHLVAQGYNRYEVSNFALPGEESLHNCVYWRMKPYLGIGAGAASTVPGGDGRPLRIQRPRNLGKWLSNPASREEESPIETGEFALEFFMMGLRLARGISRKGFAHIFGVDPVSVIPKSIEVWTAGDFLMVDNETIKTTDPGMDLLHRILGDIAVELDDCSWTSSPLWPCLDPV